MTNQEQQHAIDTWPRPTTREEFEAALDAGRLFVRIGSGYMYWRARRNGKTQTWKRDPNRFRIPVKAGLRATGAFDETTFAGAHIQPR